MRPWAVGRTALAFGLGLAIALAACGGTATPSSSSGSPTDEAPTAKPTAKPTAEPTPAPTEEPEYDYPTADSVGACYDPIYHYLDGALLAMRLWDCEEPHLAEFLGSGEVDEPADGEWPGQSAVDEAAEEACRDVFLDYVGITYDKSAIEMIFYTPTEETWLAGDREIWCVADATSAAPFTSSVLDLRE
jgi:hypothetical protein